MSAITGNVYALSREPRRRQITFVYASAPAVVGSTLVSSIEDVIAEPNELGNFEVTLAMGDYWVYVGDKTTTRDKYLISVPNDTSSYTLVSRIVSDVTQSPTAPAGASVPNASSSVFGIVKTDEDVATPIVPTGWFIRDNATAMKAIQGSSGNNICVLVRRDAGEPLICWYDKTSAEASDEPNIYVPNSAPATGRWKMLIP